MGTKRKQNSNHNSCEHNAFQSYRDFLFGMTTKKSKTQLSLDNTANEQPLQKNQSKKLGFAE